MNIERVKMGFDQILGRSCGGDNHNHKQNRKKSRTENRRGMSLVECTVSTVVVALMGMILAPTLSSVRDQQRGTQSSSNLHQIGQAAATYGFFNQGRLFSYTWAPGEGVRTLPDGRQKDLNGGVDYQTAAAWQNLEILQRLSGRIQGITKIRNFDARLVHRRYSHLVLIDFMNTPLGDELFIDPADSNQLHWAPNPLEYLEDGNSFPYGDGQPATGYDSDNNWSLPAVVQRWTFATSYQNVPSSWNPDFPNAQYVPVEDTPHLFSSTGGAVSVIGRRFIHEVASPAQKVWIFEEFDREQKGSPYFAYNHARSEKLMFDGSVNSWASGDANPSIVSWFGFEPWKQTYVPIDTFPVPLGGLGDPTELNQRFRWTFRGLGGADYGPAESLRGPRGR
jgi:type II secretory pathway pseudopilin PulG